MRFNRWLLDNASYDISYEVYCNGLDGIITEDFNDIKNLLQGALVKVFKDLKGVINIISNDLKIGINEVVKAFKERSVFNILKSFGFMITKMLKSLNELTKFIRNGILDIFKEMSKSRIIQKLKSGAIKIDELLDRYPLLKKVTGLALAGLLLWMWLNMTFIGDLDYDFNFSDIILALTGKFTINELFFSPSGLMLITLFGMGSLISFPWLGHSVLNLSMALVYTGLTKLKDKNLASIIRNKIKIQRI